VRGNERGLARLKRAKKILDEIGLGGDRLDMFFMSGSQAQAFASAARTMTERIRTLGPNPLKKTAEDRVLVLAGEKEDEEEGYRGRKQTR
jgi:coenzyme F420-reducing hydrogenase delta subunit